MDNTKETEAGLDKSLFKRDGFPPLSSLIPTSLQHVLASFAGVITPAMMIATTCGFTAEQETAIIQVALILSAIDTLLQQLPLFGRIGSGLPILTGASFAFLPALQAVGGEFGFSIILGAEMVGGIVAIIFSLFYDKIRWIFPPLVTGTVIFTIGVSLYPTAIKYIAGGVGTENFGSAMNWIVGLITFAVTFGLTNFTKGITKIGSIFFAIIIGCIVSIPFGMIDPSGIGEAAWFSLPKFMPFAIDFDPAVCITIAIIYVMVNIQLIGDLSAATAGSMDRMPKGREISGGIMAQGLVSILSSLFGGVPTSAFGQNVGIIVSTKVINRWVFAGAAIVFMAGGATISVFGTITLNGIRILVKDGLTPRTCTIFGVSVAFGLGIAQVSGSLTGVGMPGWINTIFGTSAITPCAIMAIVLNLLMPPEPVEEEKKLHVSDSDSEDEE